MDECENCTKLHNDILSRIKRAHLPTEGPKGSLTVIESVNQLVYEYIKTKNELVALQLIFDNHLKEHRDGKSTEGNTESD